MPVSITFLAWESAAHGSKNPVDYRIAFWSCILMPVSIPRTPSLRRHRPSGLAVVTLNGKDQYIGPWPATLRKPPPSTREAYDRLIAEWLANGRRLPQRAGRAGPDRE